MRNRVLAAALSLATLTLAACDAGGATGPADSSLTRAEALALNRALLSVGSGFSGGSVPAGARGARVQDASGSSSFSFSFTTAEPCPAGGALGLSGTLGGSFDTQTQAAQVLADISVRHLQCKVRADDGAVFTLNGDPKIDVGLNAASGPSGLTAFHLTQAGAFTWDRGDGNSGRCTVDVTADLVPGTQDVKLVGSFCGFALDGTVEHMGG
jgi:hypothetical protein